MREPPTPLICRRTHRPGASALALGDGHAVERVQFGKPIGSYQAIKHQLANAWMAVDGTPGALCRRGAGRPICPTALCCAAARYTAIEGALQATRTVIQVWGHGLHLGARRPPVPHGAPAPGRARKAVPRGR
jgi:alkylation response protein AidB-like acyl-CoA dehydrogenase